MSGIFIVTESCLTPFMKKLVRLTSLEYLDSSNDFIGGEQGLGQRIHIFLLLKYKLSYLTKFISKIYVEPTRLQLVIGDMDRAKYR